MEKKYTGLRERLDKLRSRGMDIPKDKSKERNVIKRYNYYNLINGYKDPFLVDRHNYPSYANPFEDFYHSGTKPSHLESLYLFDEKLRKLFLERILKIEETLKDVIVQSFYEHHTDMGKKKKIVNVLHRESEYLRRNYYDLESLYTYVIKEKSGYKYTVIGNRPNQDSTMRNKFPKQYVIEKSETYDSLIAIIYRTIGNQRKKNNSVQSYLDRHTYLPMWILSNIMTFGNISKLFEVLKLDVQRLVLDKLNLNAGNISDELQVINVSRVIHILSLFRNSCAHNERFYSSTIRVPIDDDFMGYLNKFPQSHLVLAKKGTSSFLTRRASNKLEDHRSGIYTLMFCISLFLNQAELTKFKNDIKKELNSLNFAIPSNAYSKVEKLMGLDFDWFSHLTK